jgi:hypothetical protein
MNYLEIGRLNENVDPFPSPLIIVLLIAHILPPGLYFFISSDYTSSYYK